MYSICNTTFFVIIWCVQIQIHSICYTPFLALILASKNHHILFSQVSHLNNFSIVCSQGRMAERSKAPDSRNFSVENSGTQMCAWVRIPLLSPAFLLYQICNTPLLALILVNKKFKCNQSCYSQFLALILVSKNHHILCSQMS